MAENENEIAWNVGRTRFLSALIAGGILFAAAFGLYFFDQLRSTERQRELINWQVRLGIVASSRALAVETWLNEQGRAVQSLAENASLQIYVAELELLKKQGSWERGGAVPEAEYLQSLLSVSAAQAGFVPEKLSETVNANVTPAGQAGMALLDSSGNILAATQHMPPMDERFAGGMATARGGALALIDLHSTSAGIRIGFVAPIYAIQATGGSDIIGFVAAIRSPGSDLYDHLEQPGDTSQTGKSYLIRQAGRSIEYISPLADGIKVLQRQLDMETEGLVDADVLAAPGKFVEGRDYEGTEVLAVGRAIPSAPWILVRKVSRSEALGPFERRYDAALWMVLLTLVIVSTAIFAVWRHGASVRANQARAQYQATADELARRNQFLKAVTDGHPAQISAVSREGAITFANPAMATEYGMTPETAVGKELALVMGASRSGRMRALNNQAFNESKTVSDILSFVDSEGHTRTFQTFHVPLAEAGKNVESVLMIQDDITDVVEARERRERVLRQLVGTLVALVDQRDPFSAEHSKRVAEVSAAIAGHMDVDDRVARTCDLAGNMVNIGKFFVPDELLTKKGKLSDKERQVIRESLLAGADLLDGIEFDLPVVKVVRQLQERWNGSGYPDGLKGDEIDLSARIVATANAFVGMVSARAYRKPLSFKEAVNILFKDTDEAYDRKVVAALLDYVENHGGLESWKHYSDTE
ncbi:MAG: PAS domain S-box protein [Proteobacteria bacterium]|nr:PAS domain S-box protein [Pseudomonadota bacterium]